MNQDHFNKGELDKFEINGILYMENKINPYIDWGLTEAQSVITQIFGHSIKDIKSYVDFCGHAYPLLNDRRVYRNLCIQMVWAFLWDDALEIGKESADETLIKLRELHSSADKPVDHLYNYWINDLKDLFNENVAKGCTALWADLAALFKSKAVPKFRMGLVDLHTMDLELYYATRITDSGFYPSIYPFEVLTGLDMEAIRINSALNQLYKQFIYETGFRFAITNDLYSFKKEIKQNDYQFNQIWIRMERENVCSQVAVDMIVSELNANIKRIKDFGQQLLEYNVHGMADFVANICYFVAGNQFWSANCHRYNNLKLY